MIHDEDEDEGPTPLALDRARESTLRLLAQADALYAAFSCPATAECCQLEVTQREPWLWPTEWAVLAQRFAEEGRPLPPPRADRACPFLDATGKRCTVYAERPIGCRTFFCHRRMGPPRESAEKLGTLLSALANLNIGLWPDAQPRPLRELHGRHLGEP